jgi:glycosyltransferase involved in cell wall biosynthesis
LVVIPSYNSGARLLETALAALAEWPAVWVVLDGSTDGSGEVLGQRPGLRLILRAQNGGKGAAVLDALRLAAASGFTHVLVMDADGQHPAGHIRPFMQASQARPEAMVLGVPQFGPDAPPLRVRGRRLSNWWAQLETGWAGIGDSLFGFRVYPIGKLLPIMERSVRMRRFDFDPEAAVRLSWAGVPAVNLPAPVRYFRSDDGGVSHFRYGRDNLLLTAMHARLVMGALMRLPTLARRAARRGC